MVEVHVKVQKEIFLKNKGKEFKNELLNQISQNAKKILVNNTPQEKGRGKKAWKITKRENVHEVSNDTYYLPWVNDGTGIYGPRHQRITPRHARVLHFTWKSREWFLKSVKGQKGQKFVERSVPEIVSSIESASIIAANKTL